MYPQVVEDVPHAHLAVSESAMIGVPHKWWGKTVTAVVVPCLGVILTAAELMIEFCHGRPGGHRLSRPPTGKVRMALAGEHWSARREVEW